MSKATKVIFSLGTKRALGLFYVRLSGFSVAFFLKKKEECEKNYLHDFFLLAQS